MNPAHLAILKEKLAAEFVPHLPPLLDQTKPADHMAAKNVSRALSAFALQKIAKLDTMTAAKAIVDDYEDNGIDAIHYHQPSKKLFIVQGKLKPDEPFGQDEANALCKGVRDLVNQRYERFNANVEDREGELDLALDDAAEIVLVITHAGELVSQHAQDVLAHFLTDPDRPDERLRNNWIDFGPAQLVEEMLAEKAVGVVDTELIVFGEKKIEEPRLTYYGQVDVSSLAQLYAAHGNALLEKNIRYFLGADSSDVNRSIQETLQTAPAEFFHLSNGVTAIAQLIEPKGLHAGGRRFEIKGLSVINGAQTIASCHSFISTHPQADVAAARVMLTLIGVDHDDPFGSRVTRARNHQNPVTLAQFAALDHIQERLRRELAFDNITYRYRPEARTSTPGVDAMTIEEAAQALALFHPDPAFPTVLKKEPAMLLDTKGPHYGRLFDAGLSGRRLANCVRLYRRAANVLGANEMAASGIEKLVYRHGRHAIMWLTLHSNQAWMNHEGVRSSDEAGALISQPLDGWREKVRAEVVLELPIVDKGPLAFFRNLTTARPFVIRLRDAGI